jgi:hypothetical protein
MNRIVVSPAVWSPVQIADAKARLKALQDAGNEIFFF